MGATKNTMETRMNPSVLAEREGFEPSEHLRVRLISSQVQSTTLPPLRYIVAHSEGQIVAEPPKGIQDAGSAAAESLVERSPWI